MNTRNLVRNAVLAGLYAAVSLVLPATALANYRLTTALYVLAAIDPALIPGLAIGNAIAGIPQGPLDVILGFVVGALTSAVCAYTGRRWAPLAVLVIPTVIVPIWLGWLYHVPYLAVLPVLAWGQAWSALLGWLLLRWRGLDAVIRP